MDGGGDRRYFSINLVENNAKNITKPEVYGDFTNNETFEFYSIQIIGDSFFIASHKIKIERERIELS